MRCLQVALLLFVLQACQSSDGSSNPLLEDLSAADGLDDWVPSGEDQSAPVDVLADRTSTPDVDARAPGDAVEPLDSGADSAEIQVDAEACEPELWTLVPQTLDLLFLLDRSGTMTENWPSLAGHLGEYLLTAPSGTLQAALTFFPAEAPADPCEASSYTPPFIGLTSLPLSPDIVAVFDSVNIDGVSTPLHAVLLGSLQWATALLDAQPNHAVGVVLMTDGQPTGCQADTEDMDAIANLTAAAYNYNAVRTAVVALPGASLQPLDAIANAGATEHALDVTSSLLALPVKLSELPSLLGNCGFWSPEMTIPETGEVQLQIGGSQPILIPFLGVGLPCDDGPGWYQSDLESGLIRLCPSACAELAAHPGATVQWVMPCPDGQ